MTEQGATPDNEELGPDCLALVPYQPHAAALVPVPHATHDGAGDGQAVDAELVWDDEPAGADEEPLEDQDDNGRRPRGEVEDDGRPRRAEGRCGAKTKSSGRPCSKRAGWRTDHPGQGRCYLHGGKTPITHGRYSTVRRERVSELMDELAEDPDPMDLLPEVQLLRALVLDFIERQDELMDAIVAWHESFYTGESEPKPRHVPDVLVVGKYIKEIGALVERIHKMKAAGTITFATLDRVLEQVGVELVAAAGEAIADAAVRSKFLDIAERRIGSIHVQPDGARDGARKGGR